MSAHSVSKILSKMVAQHCVSANGLVRYTDCIPTVHGIFLGSKITADGDCSNEIKRHLILGRKAMTNIDSVLKSRGITSLTKVRTVKTMFLPVITCGCESRTIKKAER